MNEYSLGFYKIAEALLIYYSSVYYVNAKTNEYEFYSFDDKFNSLQLAEKGEDFFEDLIKTSRYAVHPDDREQLIISLSKDRLLDEMKKGDMHDIIYRLMINGEPVYHSLRFIRGISDNGDDYFIFGVHNIDEEIKRQREQERLEKDRKVFNHIAQSLAKRYATIYYVDTETSHYIEFSSNDTYKSLEVPTEGEDFFAESRRNIKRYVHPDDVDKVMHLHHKDVMLDNLKGKKYYSIVYRLELGGVIRYCRHSEMWADDGKHLIIGMEDLDDEIKKEINFKKMIEKGNTFAHIAESLAEHYDTIYYVDSETDHYIEFSSSNIYKGLEVPEQGSDFFKESRKNARRVIHPDDIDKIMNVFEKKKLTEKLSGVKRFTVDYRLMLGGDYKYTRLSAIWASDKRHIIIGVENVDQQVRNELEKKRIEQQNITYSQIATSLANRYHSIYYVDAVTNYYIEYAAASQYKSLEIETSGDDFFIDCAKNIKRVIHEADKEIVLESLTKENLLSELADGRTFSLNYRLIIDGMTSYVNLRGVWADDKRHIILGLANIDEQIRKENEQKRALRNANEKAMRDELTGVKNKNAYQEYEKRLQEDVIEGTKQPFGIVVCDVNGLKEVNDTLGHKAGDEYIRSACMLICKTFTHSPVFRVGGDEFAVILQSSDYEERKNLLKLLRDKVLDNQNQGEVIVASGMSEYDPHNDEKVADVFDRADNFMYDNKKMLKGARL